MDKVYDFLRERPKLAVGLLVVLIILVIINIGLSQNRTQSVKEAPTVIPTATNSGFNNNSPAEEAAVITSESGLITHTTSGYSISYPSDWSSQDNTVSGGGSSFVLLPYNRPSDVDFPRLTVEETPLRSADLLNQKISQLQNLYTLTRSTVNFQNISSTELDGILRLQWLSGNPQQKPVHKTILFFNQGNSTYVIEYAYFEDDQAQNNLTMINQIINSLKFNP